MADTARWARPQAQAQIAPRPATSWLLWAFYAVLIVVLVYFIVCASSTVWAYASAPVDRRLVDDADI